eukprot:765283-Hanusia_phi.AAC.8
MTGTHFTREALRLTLGRYFGMPLIDPVSGKLDMEVVKRKNKDMVLKAKEDSKTIVDIFLGRSDGKTRFGTTPAMRAKEKQVREEQQKVPLPPALASHLPRFQDCGLFAAEGHQEQSSNRCRAMGEGRKAKEVRVWQLGASGMRRVGAEERGLTMRQVLKQKMQVVQLDTSGTYRLTTPAPVRELSSEERYSPKVSNIPNRESGDVWNSDTLARLLDKSFYSAREGLTPNSIERS